MEIDNDKAITFLLSEKFRNTVHSSPINFNDWCIKNGITMENPNKGLKCKSCGKELDEIAIPETELCTACFTSNA